MQGPAMDTANTTYAQKCDNVGSYDERKYGGCTKAMEARRIVKISHQNHFV
jgi:hypothetical protein